MDIARCYAVLDVDEDASPEAVREAYRDLVRVWHPDRFAGDARLQKKAEAKLKEINLAHARLSALLAFGSPTARPSPAEAFRAAPARKAKAERTAAEMATLGARYLEAGRAAEAEAAFAEALRRDDGIAAAHAGLGGALGRLGRLSEAACAYARAIERGAGPAARLALGELYLASGDVDAARAQHDALREEDGRLARRLREQIREQTRDRLRTRPREKEEAARKQPTEPRTEAPPWTAPPAGTAEHEARARLAAGEQHAVVGRWEEAEAAFREAAALLPGDPLPRKRLGAALYQLDRPQEARSSFAEAVRLRPEVDSLYNLGGLHLTLGDIEAARRQVDALFPLDVAAAVRLANLIRRAGGGG